MDTSETLETIKAVILGFFTLQIGYSVMVFFLGTSLVQFYNSWIWEKPTNILTKGLTYISIILFGAGPILYVKFSHHPFIKRKFLMLCSIIIMFIASVIIYQILIVILHAIFL